MERPAAGHYTGQNFAMLAGSSARNLFNLGLNIDSMRNKGEQNTAESLGNMLDVYNLALFDLSIVLDALSDYTETLQGSIYHLDDTAAPDAKSETTARDSSSAPSAGGDKKADACKHLMKAISSLVSAADCFRRVPKGDYSDEIDGLVKEIGEMLAASKV